MGDVHDLDHIKLDLEDQPSSSNSQPRLNAATALIRPVQTTKTNQKLEYYLALIGPSKGVALLKVIEDLLGSDEIYVFGELLQTKPIQELATHPTHSSYFELLDIFAYRTWKDYCEKRDQLPKLNENQIRKLKLLSVITRASQSKIIPYSELQEDLEIAEVQELEKLIIDGIYGNLLKARLDQKYSRLEIESCMGRDVRLTNFAKHKHDNTDVTMANNQEEGVECLPANSLQGLKAQLESWRDRTAKVLLQLDHQIEQIRQKDQAKLEVESTQAAAIESILQTICSTSSSSQNSSNNNNINQSLNRKGKGKEDNPASDHQMDIDEQETLNPNKTRKRNRV